MDVLPWLEVFIHTCNEQAILKSVKSTTDSIFNARTASKNDLLVEETQVDQHGYEKKRKVRKNRKAEKRIKKEKKERPDFALSGQNTP